MSGIAIAPASATETTTEPPAISPGQIPVADLGQGELWSLSAAPATEAPSVSVTERLGGVAEELDQAVSRGEVTLEQALAFFAQIQARVSAA